ncbi:hypothetical protein Bca52824_017438 [Brassica carinata]|uniref:Uncharacterized protein n=1 Tax=Brassica carinata TaxID=52824 RepID=A0A8X7VN43_BRACI|nr:hypothetical protein Bca52824_017438 [Brassica carinata]
MPTQKIRKMCWIAWSSLTLPKYARGLCNDLYKELTRGHEKTGLTGNSQYIPEEITSI